MTREELVEEVGRLRAENEQLREQLTQALALIAQLQQELERLRIEGKEPPPFVKPNTPTKPKAQQSKQQRRKRAKDQNGARRRDTPTHATLPLRRYSTDWSTAPIVPTLCVTLVWLSGAFDAIKAECGEIDVREFSPSNRELPMASATEVTIESIQAWMDFYVYGAVTVVQQVLPDMLARNNGTLLFTTGASSVYHNPMLGNIGIATAGLRNWVHSLHAAVADKGIQVGHVAINA